MIESWGFVQCKMSTLAWTWSTSKLKDDENPIGLRNFVTKRGQITRIPAYVLLPLIRYLHICYKFILRTIFQTYNLNIESLMVGQPKIEETKFCTEKSQSSRLGLTSQFW